MTFESGIAFILLRNPSVNNGEPTEWGVAANVATDTDETMRDHLARWSPEAEYLGVRIERWKDATVVIDTQRTDVGPVHRSQA